MKIGYYIGALLYQHDCVVIPGFGGFIANYMPASIHPVQNTFTPPARQIIFNVDLLHNDGLLANHISLVEGITFNQAVNRIAEEIVSLNKELKAGKTVTMDGFGSLRSNQEHNIVFTPKPAHNYLEDAYGLPVFVSPAIRRNINRTKQMSKTKGKGMIMPVAVKRVAAIAIPLIAIGMWSYFNQDKITNFTSNYSSILPSSELLSQFSISSIKKSIPVYVLSHSKSKPTVVPMKPVETKPQTENVKVVKAPEVQTISTGHYLIIGGAFKSKENAEKLLGQLKDKNLDARLAGQNKNGLYLVSAASCDNLDTATSKLTEVKSKGIESAWILKN